MEEDSVIQWMKVEIKNNNQKSNNKLIKHTVGSQSTISFELELEYSKHSTHNFMVQMVGGVINEASHN
jgi:hypothetical protein